MSHGFFIFFVDDLELLDEVDGNYEVANMLFNFIWALVATVVWINTFRLNYATVATVLCVIGVYIFEGVAAFSDVSFNLIGVVTLT